MGVSELSNKGIPVLFELNLGVNLGGTEKAKTSATGEVPPVYAS